MNMDYGAHPRQVTESEESGIDSHTVKHWRSCGTPALGLFPLSLRCAAVKGIKQPTSKRYRSEHGEADSVDARKSI
jgi:hypothetical protein